MVAKILLLESDPGLRIATETILSRRGYEVQAFESVEAIIAQIDCCEFDVAVIDTGAPDSRTAEFGRSLGAIFDKPVIYMLYVRVHVPQTAARTHPAPANAEDAVLRRLAGQSRRCRPALAVETARLP